MGYSQGKPQTPKNSGSRLRWRHFLSEKEMWDKAVDPRMTLGALCTGLNCARFLICSDSDLGLIFLYYDPHPSFWHKNDYFSIPL